MFIVHRGHLLHYDLMSPISTADEHHLGRDRQVRAGLDPKKTFCLERNASGQPKHPLYVAQNTAPRPFV